MQETPKDKDGGTWAEDQKERDYYYDDSHGYEDYEPDNEEGDTETGDEESETNLFIKRLDAFRGV